MRKGLRIDKLNFIFGIACEGHSSNMVFHFGIFKFKYFPPEGQAITKENYRGFWIKKRIKKSLIELWII